MARFDSGSANRLDSGLRFDEAIATIRNKMPTITLDLQSKTDAELAQKALDVFEATDGVAKYAGAQASITALGTARTGFATSITEQSAAEAAALAATQNKLAKRAALENALNAVAGSFSAIVPPLTPADILAANLDLRAPATPIGNLPAVIDFLATIGDNIGEIDLTWSKVRGAVIYEVEYRLHNTPGAAWTRLDPSPTKSKTTVDGLTSGQEYAFRVRAVGTAGAGPWSDESVKRAP